MATLNKTKLEDFEQLVQCANAQIAEAQRCRDNEDYFKRKEERFLEQIARATKQLNMLRASRDDANDIIDNCQARKKQLIQMIKQEKHRQAIAQFLRLQQQIAAAEEEAAC